jgi:sortase A
MSSKVKSRTKGFVIVPLVLSTVTVILLCILVSPFIGTVTSAANLFVLNEKKADEKILYSGTVQDGNNGTLKISEINVPNYGDMYGKISVDDTEINADLYFGDGAKELNKGVATYNGSFPPGFGRTVLLAGHNNTYFHTLGSAKVGSIIHINTNYGIYTYKVTSTKVADDSDKTAYDLSAKNENLVMYTCYPFDMIGVTSKRYFVYADFISGPKIDLYN